MRATSRCAPACATSATWNLSLEFRWAESQLQMPQLAAELVRAGVDVIFAPSSTETGAALAFRRSCWPSPAGRQAPGR